MNEDKKERFEVLLEAIQSDFKIFGESLELLNNKVDEGFGQVNGKFANLDEKLVKIESRLKTIESKLDNKADQEKFDVLKQKVGALEALLKKP